MHAVLDRMAARVRTMVTRGRVTSTTLNPKRPLVQLSGLAGEVKTKIELFVPMGMSVYPTGNEDVLLLQIDGSRSHLVAMFADNYLSANMFGSMTDLFGERELGRVTGFSGVAGGLSGLIFPLLTGVLVQNFSYAPVFYLVALMPLVGTGALFLFGRAGYRRIQSQ